MKLLSQKEGAQLKTGDSVNVYWFSPRRSKNSDSVPSRQWEGRQEWVDVVWQGETVKTAPQMTPSDGWAVTLEGKFQLYLTSHMELNI